MRRKNRVDQKGFSLLELLIVVSIILIIATIAIPNFIRSRQNANESAAVANVRTITRAEVSYMSSSGTGSYGTIAQLVSDGTIDNTFNGARGGYTYVIETNGL